MCKKLLFFLLIPVLVMSQVQIGQDIDGVMAGEQCGHSVSLSAGGSTVAIGAPRGVVNGGSFGVVRVYQNVSGFWAQVGQDIDGGQPGALGFSLSLSADGETLAIGSPYQNGINGSTASYVQVYQNVSGVWIQLGQDIPGNMIGERFGQSVSLSANGTTLAVGAPHYDGNAGSNSGEVRVYQNVSGIWTQIGQGIDGQFSSEFKGLSVSLSSDGTVLAVGTNYFLGKVKIYRNISGSWTQVG